MVTTPANTAIAAPQSTSWAVGSGVLDKLDVVIPDGHVGLTGIQLLWGGRQAAPYEGAEWITGNDDEVTIDLDLFTGAGTLVVRTYNTDVTFPHSHHLRAYVSDLERPEALVLPGLPPIPVPVPPPEELPPPEEVPPAEELPPPEELPTDLGVLAAALGITEEELVTVLDDMLAELQTANALLEELVVVVADLDADHDVLLEGITALGEGLAGLAAGMEGFDPSKFDVILRRIGKVVDLVKGQKQKKAAGKARPKPSPRRPPRRR